MTLQREVRLRNAYNFRDTGGFVTVSGVTRRGRLYRSDALHRLDAADRESLADRGVGLVVDLRDAVEVAAFPSSLDGLDARVVHVPVLAEPPSTFLAADTSLDEFYDHLVLSRGSSLVDAVRVVARAADTPTVVHCTAGKDRTGLVVALALGLVGVARADVVADYARTEQLLPVDVLDAALAALRREHTHGGLNFDDLVRRSPPAALERVLDRIDERYGSLRGYALAHGLSADDLALLRDVLVEDAAQ